MSCFPETGRIRQLQDSDAQLRAVTRARISLSFDFWQSYCNSAASSVLSSQRNEGSETKIDSQTTSAKPLQLYMFPSECKCARFRSRTGARQHPRPVSNLWDEDDDTDDEGQNWDEADIDSEDALMQMQVPLNAVPAVCFPVFLLLQQSFPLPIVGVACTLNVARHSTLAFSLFHRNLLKMYITQ